MAEDQASEEQASEDAPVQDPQTPETTAPASASEIPAEEPFDKARAEALIRKLRPFEKQAKDAQKRLADYERREQEAETARLSKEEQLTKQLQQREAELKFEQQSARDRMNHYEVQLQAGRAGIVDPDAAVKLLDWASLDYDDEGKPTNVAEALDDLIKAKPYLAAAVAQPRSQPGNPTNPATRSSPAGTRRYTSAEIEDRAFWNANKEDIRRAMREGRIDT